MKAKMKKAISNQRLAGVLLIFCLLGAAAAQRDKTPTLLRR